MRAAIYARYSSTKQDEVSIEAQVRACQEYAISKDYQVVRSYVDEAISGKGSKTASRRQYQSLMKDCAKKLYDVILVHKYDRIARNLGEHVNLDVRLADMNVALIAVAQDFGQSKEAKMMKTMVWALSEYYIDNLSEEVKKGHRENALKGLHNGGHALFGYKVIDKQYYVNDIESEYVRKMFNCARDRLGFTDLIKEMAQDGITGRFGKPIQYTQIYEILRNEKYTGVYTYSQQEESNRSLRRSKPNAIKIENALPIIIDKALFREVQKIMSERKQTGKKSNYLCSGLVYCGNCGAKMHGSTTHRKGHSYRIFNCSKKCGVGTVSMDIVDDAVKTYLNELLAGKNLDKINEALREYAKTEKERIAAFNADIRKQIQSKQTEIDNYMNTLGSGVLPTEIISDISNKIVLLKNEIKYLNEAPAPKDFTAQQISMWLESLLKSTDERKTVEMLVERIDATKTAVQVTSTLTTVLGENGCGGAQHCLPTILFRYQIILSAF